MPRFILLDSEQADLVRGSSLVSPSAALNPIERAGTAFILGVSVLSDPAHESHWMLLGALPQLDQTDSAFPAPLE